MKLERVKQILKKVNALIENLDEQGQTSAIERDLLLRYLRDLYENVSQPKAAIETILEEVDLTPSPIAEKPAPQATPTVTQHIEPTRVDEAPAPRQIIETNPVVDVATPTRAIEPNSMVEATAPRSTTTSNPVVEATGSNVPPPVEPNDPVGTSEQKPSAANQENQTTFYDASASVDSMEAGPVVETPATTPLEEAVINKFENPVQYFPPAEDRVETSMPTQEAVVDINSMTSETEAPAPASKMETTPAGTETRTEKSHAQSPATAILEDTSGKFDALFTEKAAQDLAAKFQLQKVVTIEGAMGIAERMLTINEIFGGDHSEFMQVVTHINGLQDFDAAKKFLINGVASKYNWDSDAHKKLATDFVQLVRRKFA